MNERARIGVVVGTVAVVIGGGGYYFFGVHQPAQVRADARAEVATWDARWQAARRCLAGDEPASSVLAEAIAMRELREPVVAPGAGERRACTAEIAHLSRGDANDTGLPAVERAWSQVDRAAGAVAGAFALRGVPRRGKPGEAPPASPTGSFTEALAALDTAAANLRAATGAPAPPADPRPALPTATLTPVTHAGAAIASLESWLIASAGTVTAFAKAGKTEVQLAFTAGAAPVAAVVGHGVLRAVPDPSWGAVAVFGGVALGPIDPLGHPPRTQIAQLPGQATVFVAAGTVANGTVVAGGERPDGMHVLAFVRTTGDRLVVDPPFEISAVAYASDPAGRVAIAYTERANGTMRAAILRDAAPQPSVQLGSGGRAAGWSSEPTGACLTADRAWVQSGDTAHAVTESGATEQHALPGHDLIGCTATAAVLHKRGAAHYVVCTDACRVVPLTGGRPTAVATIAGSRVVSVTAQDHVLAIAREGAPTAYATTSAPLLPLFALATPAAVDVVGVTPAGVAVARVKLP